MLTVFVLSVYLGLGENKKLIHDKMLFRSLVDCQWYAARVVKTYGNYEFYRAGTDKITAYCLPVEIPENSNQRLY
jgi:hypothetical protein|tara:strand:- start:326 stop:550 length:225 start_codon:yes stop_codon:yes gene_type:complete